MNERIAAELVKVLQNPEKSDHCEAFERAFELTRAYAGSAGAQAAAIPVVFEKLFELFASGRGQGQ